ncbi:MAG: MFS transporter [Gemmatimonadota bacterium]
MKGLSLVSLFNDFAGEMVYPLLPAFISRTLGGSAMLLGALDGAADLTSAALKWVSGRLADRPGWRRPLILGGYATAVLVRPLISVASSAWQVVGFRVVDRVGKGLRTPPRDALIAEVTPQAQRGRAYGFHHAADHFGAVLGSVTAWFLLRRGAEVRHVIQWSIVPGVVAFFALAFVLRRYAPATAAPVAPVASTSRDAAGRVFWAPVVALAALVLTRVPEALMLLRLQDLGVAVPAIPLVWAALHIIRSAGSYPGGALTDRLGPRWTVAAGALLFAAVVGAMGLRLSPTAAIAVFLAFGLVAGLTESAERAMVARLAPVKTGRGFGAYHALTGFAALPAGLAFGALYTRYGGGTAFLASAGAVLAAAILWAVVAPRPIAVPT